MGTPAGKTIVPTPPSWGKRLVDQLDRCVSRANFFLAQQLAESRQSLTPPPFARLMASRSPPGCPNIGLLNLVVGDGGVCAARFVMMRDYLRQPVLACQAMGVQFRYTSRE